MIDRCSKWSAAVLLAVVLSSAGCDIHHDADTARPMQLSSASAAAKTGEGAVGTDQSVEDSKLTIMVRAAIAADKRLQSQHIKVDTEDAAVTLTGVVDSQSLRDRAVDLAGAVDGVTQVQDRLRVRG
jgi:hyperosmotically inducible protein